MKIMYYTLPLSLTLLTGCFTGTTSTVTEYDIATGKITKVTNTGESVIKSVANSTKDKSVITWESGWLAYISASTSTAEDPTPTFKMGVGKTDKGAITIHQKHKNIASVLPAVIQATRDNLTVTPDGIQSAK